MAILCLCCGQPAEPRGAVMSPVEMRGTLLVLRKIGYAAADLAYKPEYVESLNVTSPGFVDWLRRQDGLRLE